MAGQRASDSERERATALLSESWATGAVSTETFEKRLDLALEAQGRDELWTLTHDLPGRRKRSGRGLRRLLSKGLPPAASSALVLRLSTSEDEVLLGRHRSCTRVYDDDSVSRSHALLRLTPTGWRLSDLDSTNGTWLNGVRVREGARLVDGDEIGLGRVRLTVRIS